MTKEACPAPFRSGLKKEVFLSTGVFRGREGTAPPDSKSGASTWGRMWPGETGHSFSLFGKLGA